MCEYEKKLEWVWNSRITLFHGESDLEGFLGLSQDEYDRRAEAYAKRGVNFVNATIKFHFRLNYIENFAEISEITRRIVSACHKSGIRVYEHHSSNFFNTDIRTTYNGWNPESSLLVDILTGHPKVVNDGGHCPTRVVCINNPDFQEYYRKYITEFIETTGVDGLMYDDIHFGSEYHCGCEHCRRKFKEWFDYELPLPTQWPKAALDNYEDQLWRDWMRFRVRSTVENKKDVAKLLPGDFAFFSCKSVGVFSETDIHHSGSSIEASASVTNCMIAEGGHIWFPNRGSWLPGNNFAFWEDIFLEKKYLQSLSRAYDQPVFALFYPHDPQEGFFCWAMTKLFAQCYWRCDSNAYGGEKYLDEFTELEPRFDYLNWEKDHEDLFRFPREIGDIGVVFSLQTKLNMGVSPRVHAFEWGGWMQTLTQAGMCSEALVDTDLESSETLKRFKLIVLPNVVCLNSTAVENLKQYVHAGGKLIITHETSLRNEKGERLEDFALGDLIGYQYDQTCSGEKLSWFMDRRETSNPVFADVLHRVSSHNTVKLHWKDETSDKRVMAWTERTTTYHMEPQSPAMVLSEVGKGAVIYLAPKVGAEAFREGLFPFWNQNYHEQQYCEQQYEQGYASSNWKQVPANSKYEKWVFIDESAQAYRKLIVNLVEFMIDKPAISVHVPDGVIWNTYRCSKSSNDCDGQGSIVIGFLNVGGAQFKDGQEIALPVPVNYPKLSGKMEVKICEPQVKTARWFTPDDPGSIECPVTQTVSGITVNLDISNLCSVGFLVLDL